jgi:hypothetical protein
MKQVPAEMPFKTPDAVSILAIAVLLQVHSPPEESLTQLTVLVRQTVIATGMIGAGRGFTVTDFVTLQPVGKV